MTSNTETQTESTSKVVINPRSGLTRGVRIFPDPDGILLNPFEEMGHKMGYVYVYGEEEPAVFDGTTWHPILTDGHDWASMQESIATQYYLIVAHAEKNEAYRELANYVSGGGTY
jgi:hypothetical protein